MIRIDRAAESDSNAIARVYVEAWRHAYAGILPDAALLQMSAERGAAEWSWIVRHRADVQPVFVARAGGDVLGMTSIGLSRGRDRPAGGSFEPSTLEAPVGEIYTLYVAPDAQDRGIGRRLLAAGLAELAQRRCTRSMLWVLRDNPARFFYERTGGQRIAERIEMLWGRPVGQLAYGWNDSGAAAARLAACPARES
ncbi:MAG: GNAT family N-acetyltransferase [Alphaproteobacteria bacterium]|nr:GNAT family N-acetyltransferase [Alphaproteobacteria bacterium]